MLRYWLQAALLLLVSILLTQCADPTASQLDTSFSFSGADIVRFPSRYTELSRYVVEGTRNDRGGCDFTNSATIEAGTWIFESVREIDPLNCLSIVAQHPVSEIPAHAIPIPPAKSGSAANLRFPSTQSESSEETETAQLSEEAWQSTGGSAGLPGTQSQSTEQCPTELGLDRGSFQNLWHEDPAALWVTKSDHNGFFFYNGECVQYINHTATVGWRYGTGWRLLDFQIDIRPSSLQWEYVDANSFSTFQNPIFCALSTEATWVQYWPNQMRAFMDGYYTFNWPWYWSGGCSSWLTPYRIAGSMWL